MDKNISTLLREIKERTGWSEPRIAAELGTSQPTVNRILNGQPDCKAKTLRSIDALHQTICQRPGAGGAMSDSGSDAVEPRPGEQQCRRQSDQNAAPKSCGNELGRAPIA